MIKTSKFYTKFIIKSPIFILTLLFISFMYIFNKNILKISINYFSVYSCYAIMASNLFSVISATKVMNKDYEVMKYLEKDIFKKYIATIFSSLIISVIITIISLCFMIFFANNNLNTFFAIKGIIHFILIFNLSNLLAATIGATVGLYIRKWFSYFISLGLFGFFIKQVFNLPNTIINRFINVYSDDTIIEKSLISEQIFNFLYWIDKFFVVILILSIILVTYFILKEKKVIGILIAIIGMVFMGVLVFIGNKNISIKNVPYNKLENKAFKIENYNMELNIKDKVENTVYIVVNANKNSESLIFNLDNVFKVENIIINEKTIDFKQENDNLIINYKINNGDKLDIKINYSGKVNVLNNLGGDVFYVSHNVINLPSEAFYWYPKLDSKDSINFNININCPFNLYSNVSLSKEGQTYVFKEKAEAINLFAGNYKTFTSNDVEYIMPNNYSDDLFKDSLEIMIQNVLKEDNQHLTNSDIEIIKSKKYRKVIVAKWPNDIQYSNISSSVQVFGDTVIVNN